MAFVKRKIEVLVTLGKGETGEDDAEEITLKDLRVSANITYLNNAYQADAQIAVFGLSQSLINRLTGTGPQALVQRQNSIQILAGDEGGVLSLVYKGTIIFAYGEFMAAPDIPFVFDCRGGYFEALKPVSATSIKGEVDTQPVMSEIVSKMRDVTLESHCGSIILTNPNYSGTAYRQAEACAKEANVNMLMENDRLIIYPKNGYRKEESGPVEISKETGMIGYPSISGGGIAVTTLFNKSVGVGKQIKIKSDIMVANGEWNVFTVTHHLESEMPDGPWFTNINAHRFNK